MAPRVRAFIALAKQAQAWGRTRMRDGSRRESAGRTTGVRQNGQIKRGNIKIRELHAFACFDASNTSFCVVLGALAMLVSAERSGVRRKADG
jgi:hypothetical protein